MTRDPGTPPCTGSQPPRSGFPAPRTDLLPATMSPRRHNNYGRPCGRSNAAWPASCSTCSSPPRPVTYRPRLGIAPLNIKTLRSSLLIWSQVAVDRVAEPALQRPSGLRARTCAGAGATARPGEIGPTRRWPSPHSACWPWLLAGAARVAPGQGSSANAWFICHNYDWRARRLGVLPGQRGPARARSSRGGRWPIRRCGWRRCRARWPATARPHR